MTVSRKKIVKKISKSKTTQGPLLVEALDNGIPFIYEMMPNAKTVSIGYWILTGSRFESPNELGYSHLCEHMLFKGIHKGGPKTVAFKIDLLGGHVNASTSREDTCFYLTTSRELVKNGLKLLSDIVFRPIFKELELEREKKVIEEEIKMYRDSPEDAIFDLFMETIYKGSGLAHSELGTFESVGNCSVRGLSNFYKNNYHANNILVTMAGPLEAEKAYKMVNDSISKYNIRTKRKNIPVKGRVNYKRKIKHYEKELEQVQFILSLPGFPSKDSRNWKLELLNIIAGGNQSSRLFQTIREKKGLCYSIYSYRSSFDDTGLWAIYGSTSYSNFTKSIDAIVQELINLGVDPIKEKSFMAAKNYLQLNFLMSLESTEVRMSRLAKNFMTYGRIIDPADIIEEIKSFPKSDILAVYKKIFKPQNISLVSLGRGRLSPDKIKSKLGKK